jgi:hypothetical protein
MGEYVMITTGDVIDLSEEIANNLKHIKNEDETIDYCIKPFLKLLNYAKPAEVKRKYPCFKGKGGKHNEECDIAILKDDKPIIMIECKDINNSNLESEWAQLEKYFNKHSATKIGILTDGKEYRFYTDSQRENMLDDDYFLVYNIDTPTQEFEFIQMLYNDDNFSLRKIKEYAQSRMSYSIVKDTFIKELQDPGDEIAKLMRKLLTDIIDIKKDIIKEYLKRIYKELIDKQNELISSNEKRKQEQHSIENKDNIEVYVDKRGVKARGICNIHSMQLTLLEDSEIVFKHEKTFSGVWLAKKKNMISSGELVLNRTNDKYILRKEITFKKPSPASYFVLGRASSGYEDWTDINGNKLEDYKTTQKKRKV